VCVVRQSAAGADQAPDGTEAARIAAKAAGSDPVSDPASADWTNVRSGPSTSCAVVGVAGTVNKADYRCYVDGDASNGNTWTFLRFKDNH
jgi:uncharacterized protein YraI